MTRTKMKRKTVADSDSFLMTLEPNNNVVWKGNLWSDIVFTVSSFKIPSSALGLRVYLELMKANGETREFVPCSDMNFNGRPDFLFTTKQPEPYLGEKLSSVCDFVFDSKCLVGAKVHQDVLKEHFAFLRLVFVIAIQQADDSVQTSLFDNCNELAQRLRFEMSRDMMLSTDAINILAFKSKIVNITEYKLSIQQKFSESEYIHRRKDLSPETFEWYNKNGGDMISIDVIIHLKDCNGDIVYNYPKPLRVKTELVYDDGTLAPIYPLLRLKQKVNGSGRKRDKSDSSLKLFTPTRPVPIIGEGVGSQYFSFRIEEVSTHHQSGFKLKVSPMDESFAVFHGIMEEIIIVKSKPRTPARKRSKGGRTSILHDTGTTFHSTLPTTLDEQIKNKGDVTENREKKQLRKVSLDDLSKSSMYDKNSDTISMRLPTATTIFTGCNGKHCIACGEELMVGSGDCPSHHKSDCRFNMTLVPFALSASSISSSVAKGAESARNYKNGIIEIEDFDVDEAAESLLALGTDIFLSV